MGALLTAYQARIPSQRRIELTNQGDETATTENTTVSGAAETDAANEFVHRTGIVFDATNTEHLTLGVKGLVYFLYTYRGLPLTKAGEAAKADWTDSCGAFARTRGSLAWQSPQTTSKLDPTDDQVNAKPYFDPRNLRGLVPRPPHSADPYTTLE